MLIQDAETVYVLRFSLPDPHAPASNCVLSGNQDWTPLSVVKIRP